MSKTQSVYERLADRLSRTPNGLPRSPKGTELKVLAKLFSPEQAALGQATRTKRADAATIAAPGEMATGPAVQESAGVPKRLRDSRSRLIADLSNSRGIRHRR